MLDMEIKTASGYKVVLINTHQGNDASLGIGVQTGSGHDEPIRFAGRAHLWEHSIFLGCEKYPNKSFFFEQADKMGALNANAYTSNSHTLYYLSVHPDSFASASDVLGCMLTRPIWNNKAFLEEREVVKNEADSYQKDDQTVLFEAAFTLLLPEGHPYKKYSVGTSAQLSAMDQDSFKQFYYSQYQADSMQIVVSANFDLKEGDDGYLSKESVLETLAANFKSYQNPEGRDLDPLNKSMVLPDLKAAQTNKSFVRLSTSNQASKMLFTFHVDGEVELTTLDLLVSYLGLEFDGSLIDQLKKDNLIAGMSFGIDIVNNLKYVYVITDLGPEHQESFAEILDPLYTYLNQLIHKGLDPETLEYLVNSKIQKTEAFLMGAESTMKHYVRSLNRGIKEDIIFDVKARFAKVSNKAIATAAQSIFDPQNLLGTLLSPKVESKQIDPLFSRQYEVEELGTEAQKKWTALLKEKTAQDESKIDIPKLPIKFAQENIGSGANEARPQIIKGSFSGNQDAIILQKNHLKTRGAISLSVKLPALSIEDYVALKILDHAFDFDYMAEFEAITDSGIAFSNNLSQSVAVSVEGNSQASLDSINWYFDRLQKFKLSEDTYKQAFAELQRSLEEAEQSFPAKNAGAIASSLLSGPQQYTRHEIMAALTKSSKQSVLALQKKLFDRGLIRISAYGDYNPQHLEEVHQGLRAKFKNTLSEEEQKAVTQKAIAAKEQFRLWAELPESRDEGDFAHLRAYRLKHESLYDRKHAALKVLMNFIRSEVFRVNRDEKALGYVQSSVHQYNQAGHWLIFLGETSHKKEGDTIIQKGSERVKEIEEGWKQVIDLLSHPEAHKNAELVQKLQNVQSGLILQNRVEPIRYSSRAQRHLGTAIASNGQTLDGKEFDQLLKEVKVEEVLEAAAELFGEKHSFDVLLSRPEADKPCENYLASAKDARALLVYQ